MMRRRRPLARGAMVAGAGYAAGRAHANKAAQEQAQEQRITELEAQAAAPAAPAPPAPNSAPDAGADRVRQLTQLKELLDAGALTQAEFDVEKARSLSS